MPACVGLLTAEDGLKEIVRNHRRVYSLASRSRTFGTNDSFTLAVRGFLWKGDAIECSYCHYTTTDTNEQTLDKRHGDAGTNCIFITRNN